MHHQAVCSTSGDLELDQVIVKGPLIVCLLSVQVCTEGHLQTTVLPAQDCSRQPALNIAICMIQI